MLRLPDIRNLLSAIFLIGSMLVIVGTIYQYSPQIPTHWTKDALIDLAAWMFASLSLAAIVRVIAPTQAVQCLVGVLAAYFVVGVHLDASIAVVLLFVSAFACGRALLLLMFREAPASNSWSQYIFAGLAVQIAVFGVLIHFPVNYRITYTLILALPIGLMVLRTTPALAWDCFKKGIACRVAALESVPYSSLALSIALLGITARYAFFPSVGYDENALHLSFWTQLSYRHQYSFDVITQVWEVAPNAVDLLHAAVSIVAGEDARGALNLALLLLLYGQLWAILTTLPTKGADRLLALALFASTPMLANLLGTLQAELFLAVLLAGGVRLTLEVRNDWLTSRTAVIVAIAAMAVATKAPGAVIALLLIGVIALQLSWHGGIRKCALQRPRNWIAVLLFLAILILLAFHSYLTSWTITGNPFFPLYNGIFKSPYFEAKNFSDTRWLKGATLENYWGFFFRTSGYLEANNYVAGFQYLLLPFIALLLITKIEARRFLILLIPMLGFGIVMFAMIQYWRYFFPVLPLATVAISATTWTNGVSWTTTLRLWIARAVALGCIALNLYFLPGISWVFESAPGSSMTLSRQRDVTERVNPVKLITEYINERYKGAKVLYPGSAPFGATLKGAPVYVNWYSPSNQKHFKTIKSAEEMGNFLKAHEIRFVIWSTYDAFSLEDPEWRLREFLSRQGYPELRIGNYTLFRIVGHALAYRPMSAVANRDLLDITVITGNAPNPIIHANIGGATILRYAMTTSCQTRTGRLALEIAWNAGPSYYRLIPCGSVPTEFTESLPIPLGAVTAEIKAAAQDTHEVLLKNFELGTN